MSETILELRNVAKVFEMGGEAPVTALSGISLAIEDGDFVAILGRSGSGKSTLLSILGCLDLPTSGEVLVRGQDVSSMSENELALVRNREIGFVFQSFHLLPHYNAVLNVEMPLLYAGRLEPQKRAAEILERVGLGERLWHFPHQMSGGQRQRVAIARALANNPHLLLADEPTGNLDSRTGQDILTLFHELNATGATVVIVTHDHQVAAVARRVISLADGSVASDRRSMSPGGFQ
ncbi:MAG TPA: macrolide ABC transporter ATP-binding protein [Elusimicrobia bacterium]|nr:macrolide ABC transporter ATP-binding protein [Elusimicrobiota bacterium]